MYILLCMIKRYTSKDILQSELHDPRVAGYNNLAEGIARRIRIQGIHAEAVGEVECFRPELDPLRFPHLEVSRQRQIELPCRRASNGAVAQIAQSAWEGRRKRVWIEEVLNR